MFLRVLEYYAGILFLTTNRVGDFDEAFSSRIHISLHYPKLNEKKTTEVFKLNMAMIEDRFKDKGRQINIDKVEIGGFAVKYYNSYPDARWNGRQIRNACQTALALAEFEAQGNSHKAIQNPNAEINLRMDHLETVANAYREFAKYQDKIDGTDADRRALEDGIRAVDRPNEEASDSRKGATNEALNPLEALAMKSRSASGAAATTEQNHQSQSTSVGSADVIAKTLQLLQGQQASQSRTPNVSTGSGFQSAEGQTLMGLLQPQQNQSQSTINPAMLQLLAQAGLGGQLHINGSQ